MRFMALLLLLTMVCSVLSLTPFHGHDLSRLTPVRLLLITPGEGGVTVSTEKRLSAWGRDLPTALSHLSAAATGHLLLATAEKVVFSGTLPDLSALAAFGIRPATALYRMEGTAEEPDALCAYLEQRRGAVTLGALQEDENLPIPILSRGGAGLYLEEGALP